MVKINKILAIILITILGILSFCSTSFAEGEEFTCTLKSSSAEAKIGDEVTITFSLSSLTGFEEGIMGISAAIEYEDDVLEYVGNKALNDWNITYNNDKKLIAIDRGDYAKKAQDIFTMTFKIKETTKETTTIKIKEIVGSENDDIETSDVSTTIKITKVEEKEEQKPTGDGTDSQTPNENGTGSQTPTGDGTSSENPNENGAGSQTPSGSGTGNITGNTQKQEKLPTQHAKLGTETIAIPVILVIAIVGIIFFIQYRRYKDVK